MIKAEQSSPQNIWGYGHYVKKTTPNLCEKLIICSFLSFLIWRSTWDFPHGFPILQRCFWRRCHWKQWGKFVCQVSGLLKCDNHAFSLLTENIPEVCYFSIQVHKLHIRYLQIEKKARNVSSRIFCNTRVQLLALPSVIAFSSFARKMWPSEWDGLVLVRFAVPQLFV